MDPASGKVTGRICHIKAKNKKGPRYDPLQSLEARHAFANLLLLCPIHHDVVDSDLEVYTVERLLRMKADHEIANAGSSEPPDDIADEIIRISNLTINTGSILLAFNQSGGQMAHNITNVFNQAGEQAATILRAKRIEIYGELWQSFVRAKSAVFQIASGFRRVPPLQNMSLGQFAAFVETTEFPEEDKRSLLHATDRAATFNQLLWRKQVSEARESWRLLHNYATATRIYLSDTLKAHVSDAGALISRMVIHAEVSGEESNLNFEATDRWLRELDTDSENIEQTMAAELAAG